MSIGWMYLGLALLALGNLVSSWRAHNLERRVKALESLVLHKQATGSSST